MAGKNKAALLFQTCQAWRCPFFFRSRENFFSRHMTAVLLNLTEITRRFPVLIALHAACTCDRCCGACSSITLNISRRNMLYVLYYYVANVITVRETCKCETIHRINRCEGTFARRYFFLFFFQIYGFTISSPKYPGNMSINTIIGREIFGTRFEEIWHVGPESASNGAINMYFVIKQWVINFQNVNSSQKPALINSSIYNRRYDAFPL